jgi:6-phosphogluconolactonase
VDRDVRERRGDVRNCGLSSDAGAVRASSATIVCDMANLNRRKFVLGSTAFSLAAAAATKPKTAIAASSADLASRRILVGSGTPDGILAFRWDPATGSLEAEGIAVAISHSTWLQVSPDRRFLYVACELDEFEGKPTGAVASFHLENGKLTPISTVESEGKGTCHLTTDQTGRVVICANYSGGSSASFVSADGKLGAAAWSEHYKGYPGTGPVADRQEAAHAHFASVSPDNRFAYVNDLGADKIHIYKLDAATGKLTPAGAYEAKPGDGPRTLHFHPNGKIAYCMNELNSTVTAVLWSSRDGSLLPFQTVSLLPAEAPPAGVTNTGCDTVITRDGRFAYFANRGNDFIMGFHIQTAPESEDGAGLGKLTPFAGNPRTSTGGKIPRNFTLDPTERWMLVADQGSSNLAVFARNPKTGELATTGKTVPAATPMCIVFV